MNALCGIENPDLSGRNLPRKCPVDGGLFHGVSVRVKRGHERNVFV